MYETLYDTRRLTLLFFFKQKTAYEIEYGLVGSEMCIRDSSRGGGDDPTNLVAACLPCNQLKGNRTPGELGWRLHLQPPAEGGAWPLLLSLIHISEPTRPY